MRYRNPKGSVVWPQAIVLEAERVKGARGKELQGVVMKRGKET